MYMKNKSVLLGILVVLICACSSYEDKETPADYTVETVSEAPSWYVDYSGNESRPDWQEPNPAEYENWTIMLVQLEDALKPCTTGEDLLALFVDGELRGLTSPAVSQGNKDDEEDKGTFVLKAYGNEADQNMVNLTLSYYCSQLKQTFSRTVQTTYDMDKVYGLDEDLIPQFTLGSVKYPVVTQLMITAENLSPINVTFGSGDMLAAFVGNECRGILSLNDQTTIAPYHQLTVLGRQEDEAYTLKYYNAATQRIYTLSKSF